MKGIIIELGAPNSDTGILSEIAVNRLDCAIRFYLDHNGYKILCTGGFGRHFNTTPTAHAVYAANYLMHHQIPAKDIIAFALSRYTEDDAIQAKPIVDKYRPHQVVVITSDFHMKRVKLIFSKHFAGYNLWFVEAQSTVDATVLAALKAHELEAIQRFKAENEDWL